MAFSVSRWSLWPIRRWGLGRRGNFDYRDGRCHSQYMSLSFDGRLVGRLSRRDFCSEQVQLIVPAGFLAPCSLNCLVGDGWLGWGGSFDRRFLGFW